ncbi:MAG: hypothetical protein ACM3KR_10170 [Deltaproteobacteria bacterium]
MGDKLYRPYRIYKVEVYFQNNIIEKGKDPLELLFKIAEAGDVVESNTNVSQIPLLDEINPKYFYLSWTFLLRSKFEEKELKNIFLPYKNISTISVEEYDEDYLTYTSDAMMGNKIGEVLIEKGLINEEEIKSALREQKKLGEILIDAGLITREQIDSALKAQKKIGQILIESGKIAPNKLTAIIEQQKQIRQYKEMNTLKVDINRLDVVMSLLNKLSAANKEIQKAYSDRSNIDTDKIQEQVDSSEHTIAEIKKMIDKCRNAT